MRAVKAKALRRALGFKPNEERDYAPKDARGEIVRKTWMTPQGVKEYFITGTIIAKGARGAYQRVKRSSMITGSVLRAHVEVQSA